MKIAPVRSAVVESVPLRPDPGLPSGGPVGARTTVHAMLVAFLAWAALLCAGLGGTVGVVSQTLATKLAHRGFGDLQVGHNGRQLATQRTGG